MSWRSFGSWKLRVLGFASGGWPPRRILDISVSLQRSLRLRRTRFHRADPAPRSAGAPQHLDELVRLAANLLVPLLHVEFFSPASSTALLALCTAAAWSRCHSCMPVSLALCKSASACSRTFRLRRISPSNAPGKFPWSSSASRTSSHAISNARAPSRSANEQISDEAHQQALEMACDESAERRAGSRELAGRMGREIRRRRKVLEQAEADLHARADRQCRIGSGQRAACISQEGRGGKRGKFGT